jgi:two-component system, sensor histidine kinase PdtaS
MGRMASTCRDGATAVGARTSGLRPHAAAVLLTTVLFLVLSALAGLMVWQSYRDAIASAEARAAGAAHVVAAHSQWLVEASEQALRRVDEALGDRPDLFVGGTAGDLNEAVAGLPEQVVVWVFDAEGKSVLTNDPEAVPIAVEDREYFQVLRDGAEWHITALFTSKVGNHKAFGIARRIDRDGRFVGVAAIGIHASLMAEFWAPLDLGPGSTVSLIRDDGWLVARHPAPEASMDLSDHVLFTEHLPRAPTGTYSARSPADGVVRIVGYRRVSGAPLIAIGSVAMDTALSRFRSRMRTAGAVAAPVALALLAVSIWVVALLRREERNRAELAAALAENRLLFQEIHHRVKNNLQTVSSLVQLQPLPSEVKREMVRRLAAMSAVHEQIYRADRVTALDLGQYLGDLLESLKESYVSAAVLTSELVSLQIDPDRAQALGLIVSETVSNAFKHAFAKQGDGHIVVTLEAVAGGRARLTVRDDGIGMRENAGDSGMGLRLVKGLAGQLGADYRYERNGGTTFLLEFPITAVPGQSENRA